MTMYSRTLDRFTANQAFNAFVFTIFACGMLEAQLFKAGAGIRPHLLVTLIGGLICVIALRRRRVWWPDINDDRSGPSLSRKMYSARHAFSCAILSGIGVLLGLAAKSGSYFLFALLIMAMMLAPWSRIELCRTHFFMSITSLVSGAVASYLLLEGAPNVLTTLFHAWVLLTTGLAALLSTYRKPHDVPKEATGKRTAGDATSHI